MNCESIWLMIIVYFLNFEIGQIPATNQNFSGNSYPFSIETSVALVNFPGEKCYQFLQFEIYLLLQANKQKITYFVARKIYTSKLWRTWSLVL